MVERVYERAGALRPGRAAPSRLYGRVIRALIAALTALLWVGPFAFVGAATPDRCSLLDHYIRHDGWRSIPAPAYPSGPRSVVSYTASAVNPGRLLVTNGLSVMSSSDGGCKWRESFSLASVPPGNFTYSSADSRIVQVQASRLSDQVAFVIVEQLRPVSRVHVAVTYNWGASWESGDQGLETAIGSLVGFSASPTNSEIAYLSVGDGATGSGLFVSDDGGRSWFPRRTKAGGLDIGTGGVGVSLDPSIDNYTGVTVDPTMWEELWLPSGVGLYHSVNGGRTIEQDLGVPAGTSIGVVDIFHYNPGYPSLIKAFSANSSTGFGSNDGGETFAPLTTPGVVQSASNAINRPETAIGTDRGVYVLFDIMPAPSDVWNISPGNKRVVDVQMAVPLTVTATQSLYAIYARTDNSIERFIGTRVLPEDPTELIYVDALPTENIQVGKPRLTPPHRRIVLERGESKTIDYDLFIPNSPNPLDVYFLIDISGSMQGAINGIRAAMREIVEQLLDAKIDVYFGVGEYRSYTDDPAYHRILPVSPPGPGVVEALNSLEADGGGDETQLEALYQAATGAGRGFVDILGLPVKRIDAGQQAGFRGNGSLRVVLNVTDEDFSTGQSSATTPEHPSYDKVIGALRAESILQLGLAIQEGPRAHIDTPRRGLDRVADGTDALAPAGGVDCDGDGSADLVEDEPLVCVIDPEDAEEAALMAPAIVNLLRAIEDPATVGLEPRGAVQVVKSVSPPIGGVNFKEPNRLDYDATYSCPHLDRNKPFDVRLQATNDGLVLKTPSGKPVVTTTRVICRPPVHVTPEDPVADVPVAALLPPIAPPPPRPPDIVPNPNPQPQGQAQANAALAAQKEERPQLAVVDISTKADEVAAAAKAEEKYAMSSYSRRPDRGVPPEAVLMIGAASMCMMFGCATLVQQRVRTQQVRR